MKLKVNFIGERRYWRAGEEIPDEEVPTILRWYAVTGDHDGALESLAPEPALRTKRHVNARKRTRR